MRNHFYLFISSLGPTTVAICNEVSKTILFGPILQGVPNGRRPLRDRNAKICGHARAANPVSLSLGAG